jgi:hypothetical protein
VSDSEIPRGSPEDASAETRKEILFAKTFGITKDALRQQGIDPDDYAAKHIEEALRDPENRDRLVPRASQARADYFALGWRVYLWYFVTIGILLVSTIPHLGKVAEALRILAVVPLLIGLNQFAKQIKVGRRSARFERREELALATAPLLPYHSGDNAWIGKGPGQFSRLEIAGSVYMDRDRIVLAKAGGNVLAGMPVNGVSVHIVPIWFGLGVKLDMGSQGSWYVQPHYSPTSPTTARRATKRLRAAISAAKSTT